MADFHTHTIFSDGELVPAELIRRAKYCGAYALAITDHADFSNIELNLSNIKKICEKINLLYGKNNKFRVLPGVEITHVPPALIKDAVNLARKSGALIVVVHGETLSEPVEKGTNLAALEGDIDILSHPGLITEDEVKLAKENGIYLELSYRKGHCLANGHIANIAKRFGAGLIISSDAHSPSDILDETKYNNVGLGAGLTKEELDKLKENAMTLLKKYKI
ncbi:MAG: histidinol phosphate phosphatase domain-containing protein [Deltaproteobacteria bacterium]|nr:histidinol phosphate phosphatase domain-containing protein [Deltaproteobacteria bacterium]MCL5880561.1 histidinol phosphate phosphatase domain-containing protein [Deltaproteobacteria bacterium]